MSQQTTKDQFKAKIEKYKVLICYGTFGILGVYGFTKNLMRIRLQNMKKFKAKSRVAVLHTNMKRWMIGGIFASIIYAYGFFRILINLPSSQSNRELYDEGYMAEQRRKSPEFQDLYLIKSMQMFGVSKDLIQKTKQQFLKMDPQGEFREKAGFQFSTDLIWALLKRKSVQRQYAATQVAQKNN